MSSNYSGQSGEGLEVPGEFSEALRRRAQEALDQGSPDQVTSVIDELSSLAISQIKHGIDPHSSIHFLIRFSAKDDKPFIDSRTIFETFPETIGVAPELFPALVVAGSMAIGEIKTVTEPVLDPYFDSRGLPPSYPDIDYGHNSG